MLHAMENVNLILKYPRECGYPGTLILRRWDYKMVKPRWKTVWLFLKKLSRRLLYDSAISLLNVSPGDRQTYVQAKICSLNVHHSPKWRQLERLPTDEEVNKIWWNTMGCSPAVGKTQCWWRAAMRMVRSVKETNAKNHIVYDSIYTKCPKRQICRDREWISSWLDEDRRVKAHRHVGSFWGDGICSPIGWWWHKWILWYVNYTLRNLLKYPVPETLLHSYASSIHHEARLACQAALVSLGRPSLQDLEGREVWSSLLPCTYLHVISYSMDASYFINVIVGISFKKRWLVTSLPSQRKD